MSGATAIGAAIGPAAGRDVDAVFEPNRFPLGPGIRLLEASAGTGKTFALAHLVLRLVVERGLTLDRLLVVTFTEAAAAELRQRIGQRLQQVLLALSDGAADGTADDGGAADGAALDAVLADWLRQRRQATAAEEADRDRARLMLALDDLQRADITTIHGFCRRALQRHALEAGLPPDADLDPEPGAMLRAVSHDYWQEQVLALPPPLVRGLQRRGLGPGRLADLLGRLDDDPSLEPPDLPTGFAADRPLGEALLPWMADGWESLLRLWEGEAAALQQRLCECAREWRAAGASTTRPYAASVRKDRVGLVRAWLAGRAATDHDALLEQKELGGYFHPGCFCRVARSCGETDPSLPAPRLMEAIARMREGPAEGVLAHAGRWGLRELQRRRRRRGVLSFSDLLRALDPGRGGGELRAGLRHRYAAALIDEFQDTDPIQWRILSDAFARRDAADGSAAAEGPDRLLLMVGDPKQAIYRFRGGDLATYRLARGRAERIEGLRENFRTDPALVAALGGLMAPGLRRSRLPVPAVRAAVRGEHLQLPDGESPLQLLWLGENGAPIPSRTELEGRLPDRVAEAVLTLLQRRLRIGGGAHGSLTSGAGCLTPADVCVIVDRHQQAEQLRQALEARGLPSRLVSKGDILESPGAATLQRLLDALAEPADPARLRLLAATPLLDWTAGAIASPTGDHWDRLAADMADLAAALPERGLLGSLSDLLEERALAGLVRSGRLLADLQQAAELVQDAMHRLGLGAAAAAAWLRQQRLDPEEGPVPESRQPNSSVADDAVRVITIHRSKGLEFPVVVCPTLWQAAGGQRAPDRRWRPEASRPPRLSVHGNTDWGPGYRAQRQDRCEREAERERLAYVAVTRARHLLLLAWGPAAGQAGGPLGGWLFPGQAAGADDGADPFADAPAESWRSALEERIDRGELTLRIRDADGPGPSEVRWRAPAPRGRLEAGPVPRRSLGQRWERSSYSSWVRGAGEVGPGSPREREEGRDVDPLAAEVGAEVGAEPAAGRPCGTWSRHGPLEDLPRGAGTGDCLHRILEEIPYGDGEGNGEPVDGEALIAAALRENGLEAGHGRAVREGLGLLWDTPFGGALGDFRVGDIRRERRLNELRFDLPCAISGGEVDEPRPTERPVAAEALARVFHDHPGRCRYGRAYASRLAALPLATRGFLTGSIDLVFTAPDAAGDERWWVADWKTTWSGERDDQGRARACGPAHYDQAAMTELNIGHHYVLQAQLYLVALHRHLGWRLAGYDPRRHLGGSVTVFLRGVPGSPGRGHRGVPGMLVDPVECDRLLALDRLLREGDRR